MNVFYLSECPEMAAMFHCDKHVTKMILETAQLLSGAIQSCADERIEELYKVTHLNHPCSIWARKSKENFIWLYQLGVFLGIENEKRYGKRHKSSNIISNTLKYLNFIPDGEFTSPSLAMPDQYKTDNPVVSYRNYYKGEKSSFATWKLETPYWWDDED
jgi:hypothetical protein